MWTICSNIGTFCPPKILVGTCSYHPYVYLRPWPPCMASPLGQINSTGTDWQRHTRAFQGPCSTAGCPVWFLFINLILHLFLYRSFSNNTHRFYSDDLIYVEQKLNVLLKGTYCRVNPSKGQKLTRQKHLFEKMHLDNETLLLWAQVSKKHTQRGYILETMLSVKSLFAFNIRGISSVCAKWFSRKKNPITKGFISPST